jgi:hypothetical protein
MSRWLSVVLAAVALTLSALGSASAQDVAEGELLGAADCTAEPVDLDAVLEALVATPSLGQTPPAAGDVAATPPSGHPADEETVAAVKETVRQFFACTNAGDQARFLALLSPALFISAAGLSADDIPDEALIPEISATTEAQLAPATPIPDAQRNGLVAVRDVVLLDDGRVAATVVSDAPGEDPAAVLFIFVERDGRYLIDLFEVLAEESTPAA